MTRLLINYINNKKGGSRQAFGMLSGITGIALNIFLCVMKFIIGSLTKSVAVTADAFNNLSDAASNIVTIFGTKLSEKPVDSDHPFGHGRIEYISALVVSGLIFLMGYELAKSSVSKIIHPEAVGFSIASVVVLVLAIAVKLWMAYFNGALYKATDNVNLKAVRQDSLNDSISTFATLAALVISHLTGFNMLDGAVGIAMSVLIIFSGIGIVKDIIGPLLGQAPSKELVDAIEETIMQEDLIVGVHDLIVHDYGPGRIIASAHAEVPASTDIMAAHDVIDNVEKAVMKKLNIIICIHMDPVVTDNENVNSAKELTRQILAEYDSSYSFHDFRMVEGPSHTNIIFDLLTPADDRRSKEQIKSDLVSRFKAADDKYELVIQIEHSFV